MVEAQEAQVTGNYHLSDYPTSFSWKKCIFLNTSFVLTSRVGNINVSLISILQWKTTHEQIHYYNIKHLQYISVNTSDLELCQLA